MHLLRVIRSCARAATVALALPWLAGCGVNGTGACDFRAKQSRCQEREGLPTTLVAFEQLCKTSQGAYLSGPCPRENAIGGCDLSEVANPIRDWYYSDPSRNLTTTEQVKAKCEGKPFIAP